MSGDVCSDKCWFAVLCRFRLQCSSGLRRRSAAARLLGLWVRIPTGAWMSVCCECCVLSGKVFCDELITRPEEFYQVWCVWLWSWILDDQRPWPTRSVAPWQRKKFLKLSLRLTKHHNIMVCGSVEMYLHALLASEVDASCVQLCAFTDLCAGKYISIPYILESNPHPNLIRTIFLPHFLTF